MTDFNPWLALVGGGLIGLAATLLMLLLGRIAGISGIMAGVLDGVGGEVFTKSVHSLGPNGRILTLGFSGGNSTLSFHGFDLSRGSVIMAGAAGFSELPRAEFERVLELFEQGVFKPVPTTVFPWTKAGAAQQ